jgi:hypothetical protein
LLTERVAMAMVLPFLTAADPIATSEGSLDPLGLYQIAELLGTELVPAVLRRMLRVRFRSAMAVGAFVTKGLKADPRYRKVAPYLVWESHVVEAMVRSHEQSAEDRSTCELQASVDGGRNRRRGDRVAAVQNGGAQPCSSLQEEDRCASVRSLHSRVDGHAESNAYAG